MFRNYHTGVPMLSLKEAHAQKYLSDDSFEMYRRNGVHDVVVIPRGSIIDISLTFGKTFIRERAVVQSTLVASYKYFLDSATLKVRAMHKEYIDITIPSHAIVAFSPIFTQDGRWYTPFEVHQAETGDCVARRYEYDRSSNTWAVDMLTQSSWESDPYYVQQIAEMQNHPLDTLHFNPTFPPIVSLDEVNDLIYMGRDTTDFDSL